MKDNTKGLIFMVVFVIVIVGGIFLIAKSSNKDNNSSQTNTDPNTSAVTQSASLNPDNKDAAYIDRLVKFMASKGMAMYGASWCPHCQAQKEAMGTALKDLNYVECSSDSTKPQAEVCSAVQYTDSETNKAMTGIQGYPTWVYNRVGYSGEKTITQLAQIVGFTDAGTSQ